MFDLAFFGLLKMPYSIHFISLNKECKIATLHFTLNVASMPVATIIKYKFYSLLSSSQIRMNSNPVKCSYIKQSNSDAEIDSRIDGEVLKAARALYSQTEK